MKVPVNSARRAPRMISRSMLATLVILQGCAVVPQVAQTCPKLPPAPLAVDLSEDFQTEIETYLGLEPEPIKYELTLPNAKLGSPK